MTTYILGGSRTPIGSLMGSLSTVPATQLGGTAIKGAVEKAGVKPEDVNEVFMGHVVQAGTGQAPARQAAISAGLDKGVTCTTINKVCGSGLQTVLLGHYSIQAGDNDLVVAGGMENMSLAPHLMPASRTGLKFGEGVLRDSMQWDGLWDVYSDRPMGNCAEECAKEFTFTREAQDEFALESYKRSQKSIEDGTFANEITPVVQSTRKGDITIDKDEEPGRAKFDKIPQLRPAFDKAGTITAANASTINDGAAAIVLASEKYKDLAKFKIVGHAKHAHDPTWFTTAPVEAMKKNFEKTGLSVADIDYFEINEAFSVVTMAAIKSLELDPNKVNIFGGAVSLGHPIGCSGTRILVTLMNVLETKNAKRGMASICIGGGEALSLIIERV
jgi:acetyl-CoA C-acetyltransferase